VSFFSKICYWSTMSVNHGVGLGLARSAGMLIALVIGVFIHCGCLSIMQYFHDGMFIIIKGVMAYWYMFSSWCECLGLVSRKMSVESISSENLLKPDMSWVESSLILHLTHCSSFWKQQKSRAHGSCKLWTTCSNPTASVAGCFGLQPSTVSFEHCCRSWKQRNATVWSRR